MEPGIKTIVAFDSRSGDRTLIAEVHPHINGEPPTAELTAFEQRLFNANVRTGLFVTATHFIVVRDMLSSMDRSKNNWTETPVPTDDLFPRMGSEVLRHHTRLDAVLAYLKMIPHTWAHTLPPKYYQVFMPHVIGSLYEAEFEAFDGDYTNYAVSA